RVNYTLNDRYIVSATLRRDGSSKFGENHKWGTFPSISAAWRIGEESFMQGLSNIFDELKLRAGYGLSGNQDGLAPYQSMQLYGASGTYYDNGAWHTAYVVSQNANPNLQWEQTAMANAGIDFSILNARLNGTIEYYNKITSKLLYTYSVPVPPFLYGSMVANVGSMENKGIEFSLTGDIIRSRDIRWTVSLNAAHNKNKITKLSDEEYTTQSIRTGSAWVRGGSANTTHIVEEGKPVGQFFGLECFGLDENGLYKINDMVDGQPGVTVSDYTYIGNAQPKLTYGIDNSFSYKNFELTFFWRGVYGNDVLNFSKMSYATTQWLPGANVLKDALTLGLKQSPFYNSFYIEKGSFLRLENINLAYSFNPRLLGIKSFRVYFTGNNLVLLTKYKGVDPEVPMSGLDPGVEGREYYPKSRTYLFGINVSF
ncbi:MAG TPA: TonB-dependent receptor, partial [Bacteroidales bacterium]|nr:TonB-dependent receptor [Bacteroidales bacterium]